MVSTQLEFFEGPPGPQGLSYEPAFITPDTEQSLLESIRALPLAPFQFGAFEGKRRVLSFGWHYDFAHQRLEEAQAIPPWITPVTARIEDYAQLSEGDICHVLFTEYDAGSGIGWHRDKKQFDRVFGLSLASPCQFRFRRKAGSKWERYMFEAQPRSLYTMTGEARHVWQHSIPPVEQTRYSITFRTMAEPGDAPH